MTTLWGRCCYCSCVTDEGIEADVICQGFTTPKPQSWELNPSGLPPKPTCFQDIIPTPTCQLCRLWGEAVENVQEWRGLNLTLKIEFKCQTTSEKAEGMGKPTVTGKQNQPRLFSLGFSPPTLHPSEQISEQASKGHQSAQDQTGSSIFSPLFTSYSSEVYFCFFGSVWGVIF